MTILLQYYVMQLKSQQWLYLFFDSEEDIQLFLPEILEEMSSRNIALIYQLIQQSADRLSNLRAPVPAIRALHMLNKVIQIPSYPLLLFVQLYILPLLQKTAKFVAIDSSFIHITSFFSIQGCVQIPHLQNLSYNFVNLACRLLVIANFIKPVRAHRGIQCQELSLFVRFTNSIKNDRQDLKFLNSEVSAIQLEKYRKIYLTDLKKFSQYKDRFVMVFMQQFQDYLCASKEQNLLQLPLTKMLKYGEIPVTSQIIATAIQIISNHQSFVIRKRALTALDNLFLWGDIQVLLVINFTDTLQIVLRSLWKNYKEVNNDVEGQFYQLLLRCLQSWAQTFPNNQQLNQNQQQRLNPSPVYHLYKWVHQRRNYLFPPNPLLATYSTQAHKNLLQKTIRNKLVLNQIDENSQIQYIQERQETLADMQVYYATHRQMMLGLLTQPKNIVQQMPQLVIFSLQFQKRIQKLQVQQEQMQETDALIENGMQLVDLINLVQTPYQLYLNQQITLEILQESLYKLCNDYFAQVQKPIPKSLNKRFYSTQQLQLRAKQLKALMKVQKSDPLGQQLRRLRSQQSRKFTSKLEQRYEKNLISSAKSSCLQQMNLQIQTILRMTAQSRVGMLDILNSQPSNKNITLKRLNHKSLASVTNTRELQKNQQKLQKQLSSSLVNNQSQKKLNFTYKQPSNDNHKQLSKFSRKLEHKDSANQVGCQGDIIQTTFSKPISTQSQTDSSQRATPHIIYHDVPFQENHKYFDFILTQESKLSYLLPKIIIYQSASLMIQRSIKQIRQENVTKARVQFIITPSIALSGLFYQIQPNQSFIFTYKNGLLPRLFNSNQRYIIDFVADMKKIPLRLPIIRIFHFNTLLLQYFLPLTINYFIECISNQVQTVTSYQNISISPRVTYNSQPLKRSQLLFGEQDKSAICLYWPWCVRLPQKTQEKYVWQVRFKDYFFILSATFQSNQEVKLSLTRRLDCSYLPDSFYRYILNFMAHTFCALPQNFIKIQF